MYSQRYTKGLRLCLGTNSEIRECAGEARLALEHAVIGVAAVNILGDQGLGH